MTAGQHLTRAVEYDDEFMLEATERGCRTFIRTVVEDAGANGVVVALSGGIDSTTAAMLAVDALGPASVSGLILPAGPTADANRRDAQIVAEALQITHRTVDLQPLLDQFTKQMTAPHWMQDGDVRECESVVHGPRETRASFTEALGNAAARLRMVATYFEANTANRLVLGTSNRTESLLGYVTKFGDGAADLRPLGDLYKTEVRALARRLGVPRRIVEKAPTAGLLPDQTDEEDLGADYETIDEILRAVVDQGRSRHTAAEAVGVDVELVDRFVEMYAASAHKRRLPPTPGTYPEVTVR
ncbi:NAD+ synthase [Haloarculaceae archaeon H-GB2-1]|nr:NAD+ synthase [Haloarculaceae archaeon H-GB1-1]MEA5387047.1 NAD+ synthase [Haloarculaceae archaeon H-GB11]MEA5408549.1 NAD+ synthase [Haloarculaceae archaeon H-GB2-1]